MAKKTTKKTKIYKTNANVGLVRVCAYVALIIAAGLFLFNGLMNLFELNVGGKLLSAISLIGNICLAVGIALPAYEYTLGKKYIWRILFWIALIVYLLGCVFGVI